MPKKCGKVFPNPVNRQNGGINNSNYTHIDDIAMSEYKEDERKKSKSLEEWNSILSQIKTVSKWRHLITKRRCQTIKLNAQKMNNQQFYENLNSTLNGIASEEEDSDEDEEVSHIRRQTFERRNLSKSSNKALLIYFSKLARSKNVSDELDLDFIESLLTNGADINMMDKYGQTIFHEVARTWHIDVGTFLLAHHGNINQTDKYGRTPLHIAAAVNYPQMVKFLIDNGANEKARTYGEEQTPVHYAAKNDAVDSLRMLWKLNCDMEVRDSKGRTPLQVAAELDRSETALFLVEINIDVGVVDSSGLSALTLMVDKMPPVAKKALDCFHKTDRPNRKQYFYLNLLEPTQPGNNSVLAKTPMQAVLQNKQMNLLLHPVFRQLLTVKWNSFARMRHFAQSLIQLLFILIWSAVGLTSPYDGTSEYMKGDLKDKWWRVLLESSAVLLTLYFIAQEIYEWRCSVRQHHKWGEWRSAEIQKDLKYCHPRWPEEKKYILQELDRIKESDVRYFADMWNMLDWVTYIWIVTGIVARVFALTGDARASGHHKKILATSLIVIWLRLMKIIRAYQALGPFIVMLGNILEDTLKFCFLFMEFFIPYLMTFWMLFGGNDHASKMVARGQSSSGWKEVNDLIYSVWLVTVVGDYDYPALITIDKVMAQVLIGSYTALSGILLLNLFIALMSDTFQRVYDNAKANALMQRAIAIDTYQIGLSSKTRDRFRMFIQGQCAPQQVYYDDDDNDESGELEKMTIQIKEVVDEIKENLDERWSAMEGSNNGGNNNNNTGSSVSSGDEFNERLKEALSKHEKDMKSMHNKIDELTNLVQYLVNKDEITDQAEVDGANKFTTLPSIFDLKPEMFTRSVDYRISPSTRQNDGTDETVS